MKVTKRLSAVLTRWRTTIRGEPTPIKHMMHGGIIMLEPLQMAVFETTIKAIFTLNQTMPDPEGVGNVDEWRAQERRWYGEIARRGGFTLPDLDSSKLPKPQQCYDDYTYCRDLLMKGGLYYAQLD